MLSLEEAITHCIEVAEENETYIEYYTIQGDKEWLDECEKDCIECASEHRQLAEWLTKLMAYEEARSEIVRKMNSGQWSEGVVYGLGKAVRIMEKHLRR